MLKIQLNHIDPLLLYSFLQHQIGKLYMSIRQNYAIIKFISAEHREVALSKYATFSLKGHSIQIKTYNKQQQTKIKSQLKQQQTQTTGQASSTCDPQIQKLIESFKINSEYNQIDKIIKKYRKIMVEYVCNYDLFYKSIEQKIINKTVNLKMAQSVNKNLKHDHNDITNISNNISIGNNVNNGNTNDQISQTQLQIFLQKRLKGLVKQIKDDFKKVNINLKQYGNQKKINLQPQILKGYNYLDKIVVDYQKYSPHVEYLNNDINSQTYRLKSLNQTQFAITSACKSQYSKLPVGKLKIYNINNQYEQGCLLLKDKIYGLLALQQYILIGNYDGYITYISRDKINRPYVSCKLYDYQIKEIVKINQREWGYNIATLGRFSNSIKVKLLQVKQEQIFQGQKTLFFDEKTDISSESNVFCLQLGFQDNNIIIGNEKNLVFYDLLKSKTISKINMNYEICKVKKMKQNHLLAVANKNYISIIDHQNQVNNYKFNKNITSICPINDHSIVYGSFEGQIGLFDIRKSGDNKIVWCNKINHKARIYDIVQLHKHLVSCDSQGQIMSWIGN